MPCTYIWWQAETLSIGQGKQLVVIQDWVQIFNPLRVNITIEDDPLTFLQFSSNIVNDPEKKMKKYFKPVIFQKVLLKEKKMIELT